MVQEYIEKIIVSGENQKMRDLETVLIDTISYIQQTNKDVYCKIETDLYEIAEGKVLTEDKAKQWVNSMKPRAKWTLEEISQIKNKYNTNLPLLAAYTIMNMLFSDLGDVIGEEMTDEVIEKYIRAAEDWYYDEDAAKTEDEKLYTYVKYIVEGK